MDLLEGFVFDLQRHAGIPWEVAGKDGTEYFIPIEDVGTGVNLTTDEFYTEKASSENDGDLMLGFKVDGSNGNYTVSAIKLYRYGSNWDDGTDVTTTNYTGTIYTGALPATVSDTDATYIFNAANYKLDTTDAEGHLEIENFGTDDTAVVASGKRMTCYYDDGGDEGVSFTAEGRDNGATVRGISNDQGYVTPVLTSGSMVVKGTGYGSHFYVGKFVDSKVTKNGTILIAGDARIASDGSVDHWGHGGGDYPQIITSTLEKPITINFTYMDSERNRIFKVNGVEHHFTTFLIEKNIAQITPLV